MSYPPELLDFCDNNLRFTNTARLTFNASRLDPECAYYPVRFAFDVNAALNECRGLDDLYFDHRSEDRTGGYQHHGWQSLTLHGIDKHKTKHFVHYGFSS